MIKLAAPIAAALLASAAPALAEQPANVEATAGKLKVIHLWSTKPEAFLTAWRGPTPPNLPTSSTVKRNQPIQQFILYVNCTRDAAGECHLSATVDITAPDGTAYGEPMAFDAFKGPTESRANVIRLAPNGIGLRIEDGEQLGRYSVVLKVTDENAGETATSLIYLEAVEAGGSGDT